MDRAQAFLVQSAMTDFLNEMSAADLKASELYQAPLLRQQLMRQFVADSLRVMQRVQHEPGPDSRGAHASQAAAGASPARYAL